MDRAHGGRRRWIAEWLSLSVLVGAAATAVDAILLQYRRGYFTGGFLATDSASTFTQATLFFLSSFVVDLAVTGVTVAIVLWICGKLGSRRSLSFIVAALLALAPLLAMDFVEYELTTYLGDAFDFRLLFDLAGRSPSEILAVSSAHVFQVAALAIGAAIAGLATLWLIARYLPQGSAPVTRVSFVRASSPSIALLVAGAAVLTMSRNGSDVLDNGLRRKPSGRVLGSVVRTISDVDRDGYGVLGRPDDPNLFDARVKPYALDVPGNGIDEDGAGGDLPADATPYVEPEPSQAPWRSQPDIVLVVLESYRADARGAALNGTPVTPVLDALAAQGIAPRLSYSHNGYTVQSRRHIFTGSTADIRGHDTLIDDFKRHGYQVAYFSGQDESFGGPADGIGFDRADVSYDARSDRERRYSNFSTAGSLAVPFGVVVERVNEFLDTRTSAQPLFLYVNFHDTHFPYHHRFMQPLIGTTVLPQAEIGPDRREELRSMYMNTASNVDRAIGDVISRVKSTLKREPGVIVLSDHGESLYDEGFLGHGYALNEVQTQIPVIVANLPVALEEPFGQADLRDAIGRALERAPDAYAGPAVSSNPSKIVFQYLGLIRRPAQIAFTKLNSRFVYDFREQRVKVSHSRDWQRPGELAPAEYAEFQALVQTWERMMLARQDREVE